MSMDFLKLWLYIKHLDGYQKIKTTIKQEQF